MNIEQAKSIRIEEFLNSLNIYPKRRYRQYLWYQAPYRQDTHPSFKVNTAKNTWFDVSIGSGGDIIKLAQVMYSTNISGALEAIAKVKPIPLNLSFFNKQGDSEITIRKIRPLQNKALVQYAENRAIPLEIVRKYVQEAYYQVGNSKQYFALAFKNDKGGYEIRNKYFKGGSSPKGITTILSGHNQIALFEGFIDFLTAETYLETPAWDIVVLNSTSMIREAIPVIAKYSKCLFFGDNDNAGDSVLEKLKSENIPAVDCRYIYAGFKDFNDKYRKIK